MKLLNESTVQNASEILGADFVTCEEIMAVSKISYTQDQILALAESLPPVDTLRWCRENDYALIPAPPTAMSLIDLWKIKFICLTTNNGAWYYFDRPLCREEKTGSGWLMIKKTPVLSSESKTWDDQNRLLSEVEVVPNTVELSWLIFTYLKVRDIRLFEDGFVRTSSSPSEGSHTETGEFKTQELSVNLLHDDCHHKDLRVSAKRKAEA